MLGKSTSKAEIQDITRNGVWLFAKGREYLLAFKDYPWFKDAPVSAVYNVRLMHQSHLFWPDLDVDLDIASLENPERYPLVAKRAASPSDRAVGASVRNILIAAAAHPRR